MNVSQFKCNIQIHGCKEIGTYIQEKKIQKLIIRKRHITMIINCIVLTKNIRHSYNEVIF